MEVLFIHLYETGVSSNYLDVIWVCHCWCLTLFITLQQLHKIKCLINSHKSIRTYWTLLSSSDPSRSRNLVIGSYNRLPVCITIWSCHTIQIDIFFNISTFVFHICNFFVFLSCAIVIGILNITLISWHHQLLTRIIVQPTLYSKPKIARILQIDCFSCAFVIIFVVFFFFGFLFFWLFVVFTIFFLYWYKSLALFHETLRIYQIFKRLTFYHVWIKFWIRVFGVFRF